MRNLKPLTELQAWREVKRIFSRSKLIENRYGEICGTGRFGILFRGMCAAIQYHLDLSKEVRNAMLFKIAWQRGTRFGGYLYPQTYEGAALRRRFCQRHL